MKTIAPYAIEKEQVYLSWVKPTRTEWVVIERFASKAARDATLRRLKNTTNWNIRAKDFEIE